MKALMTLVLCTLALNAHADLEGKFQQKKHRQESNQGVETARLEKQKLAEAEGAAKALYPKIVRLIGKNISPVVSAEGSVWGSYLNYYFELQNGSVCKLYFATPLFGQLSCVDRNDDNQHMYRFVRADDKNRHVLGSCIKKSPYTTIGSGEIFFKSVSEPDCTNIKF